MNEMDEWIDFYYDNGFSIIPIREKDKKPNIPSWVEYQERRPTKKEINQWKEKKLFQNIGVIGGKVSDNLVIIDIDDKKILDDLNISVEQIITEGYWIARTGRGYHIYLRNTTDPGRLEKVDDLHIEYRANGGYTIAPPSIHPTGAEYKFLYDKNTSNIGRIKTVDTKKFYDKLVTKLSSSRGIKKPKRKTNKQIKEKGVPNGERNCSAFRVAMDYKDRGLTKDETWSLLVNWNEKNDPPEELGVLHTVLDSAFRKPEVNQKIDHDKELMLQYGVWYETHNKTKSVICKNLAELIFNEKFHFETIEDASTGKEYLYYYDSEKGYYREGGENLIKREVDNLLGTYTNIHRKREVVDIIKHKRNKTLEEFLPPPEYINLKNCVLNIKTRERMPHSPKYRFLGQIPIFYDEKADCPHVKKFVGSTFYKADQVLIQEMFGFCLHRVYRPHKAFLLLGGGRNGKSTTTTILQHFLGKRNCSAETLHNIVENRFSIANLFGKLANICGEMSGSSLTNTTPFKQITGEDPISAEKKGRDAFTFTNYAKLVFLANRVPVPKTDRSIAYFKRWIIIMMPYTFDENNPDTDINILDKMLTDDEMSGLLNWALEGLDRIRKNKKFTYFRDDDNDAIEDRYFLAAYP